MEPTFGSATIASSDVETKGSDRISWSPPPERWTLADNDVHVWCASLHQPPAFRQQLAQSLSEDERQRAGRFHFERDRNRFSAGRGLLRSILGSYLNLKPSELTFHYTDRGKPLLMTGAAPIQFNLSHSDNLALYAVSRDLELGVDLEMIRPVPEMEAIARRFFAESETNCLRALPEAHRQEGFFNCWTRKEAYLKATGDGITVALDQFEVSLAPGEPAALLRDKLNPHETSRWSLTNLKPAPGYAAALAVKGQDAQIHCWQWLTGS